LDTRSYAFPFLWSILWDEASLEHMNWPEERRQLHLYNLEFHNS
jgi:hypothetical protein